MIGLVSSAPVDCKQQQFPYLSRISTKDPDTIGRDDLKGVLGHHAMH